MGKVAKIKLYKHDLRATQVNRLIRDKDLGLVKARPTKVHPKDKKSFRVKKKVATSAWKFAWLHFEHGFLGSNPRAISNKYYYYLSLSGCKNRSCHASAKKAAQAGGKRKNWRILPSNTTISAIYYGDANRYGIPAVVIKLSSGAGILWNSNKHWVGPGDAVTPHAIWPD